MMLIYILNYEIRYCVTASLRQDNRHYEFRSALLMACPSELHISTARTVQTEIMLLSYSYTACTSSHTIEIRGRHFEDEMCATYTNTKLIEIRPVFMEMEQADRSKGTQSLFNRLTPNDPYTGRTAQLTSKRCILYIYSTNIGTEYFKHALYSPFFFLFKMQFVS